MARHAVPLDEILTVRVARGYGERVVDAAAAGFTTPSAYIRAALAEKLVRDRFLTPPDQKVDGSRRGRNAE